MHDHASTSSWDLSVDHFCGFQSTSIGIILKSRSCAWLLTGLSGVNMQMFGFLATSSRISFHEHFDYSSFSLQILCHWNIPQKCNYVHQMSLEYFNIFLSGQGQWVILDAVIYLVCMIASNLKVLALMDVIFDLFIKYKQTSYWAWQIIARFTCETYTITAWSCRFYLQPMSLNLYK